jgi:teichuronic acid biosynthesis glycosyltransferase TuaC
VVFVVRVLIITKIFPNAVEPRSAPFNRQQFAALGRHCQIVDVLATIPTFPGAGIVSKWSSAGRLTTVPTRESIAGLSVRHPRTWFVPRLGHGTWGPLYVASLAPLLPGYRGRVDVVLASWAYPDGFAGVVAGKFLGVPAVVKLHGSDVNVNAKMPGPRRQLAWALPRAARVVAVSQPLADEVAALGVRRDRIVVVRNGVDSELFHPRDRSAARRTLGLPAGVPIALYVGNLKASKGVLDLLAAFAIVRGQRPDARLVIVGGGDEHAAVAAAAARDPHVIAVGAQDLSAIPDYLAACDVLTLASWAEGTPNVVLEALASGRRVVATAVGGIPDLVDDPILGELVPARQPPQLAAALVRALDQPYDPDAVAARGARGGWDASARALADVLRTAIA